ncbi:MAG: lipoyl(octanoyl) transferase LipB [Deltaproteobacteria bacterium]|nr:lipoyl(octanoyl) transferase LipB [Deltaproteobacteria bacterium]
MAGEPFRILRLGSVPYDEALALQTALLERRQRGEIPDTILLLEHPHVITLGRRGDASNVVADKAALEAMGIEVRRVGRGGDVTYHGPGQLVGYWIVSLSRWKNDVGKFVRTIEESIIRTLAEFGMEGRRVPKFTGVWCPVAGAPEPEKIASIGVGIKRWVAHHGFALNVTTDLRYFDAIIPCALHDKRMTSMARLLARDLPIATVEDALAGVLPGLLGGPLLKDERIRPEAAREF